MGLFRYHTRHMSIGWNEVRDRARRFSKEWEGTEREAADKQTFWNDFFQVFGISRRRVATFEASVDRLGGHRGSIDLFYPGKMIMEHKSEGQDLDLAFQQAVEYALGLPEDVAPSHIVVSDFRHFRVHDLEAVHDRREYRFELKDLWKHVRLFGFLLGYQTVEVKPEDPVNAKAVKAVAKLHDALKSSGYGGHQLEMLLVRLVYCFFAEDTGIFDELDSFRTYLELKTNVDGSDTGPRLAQIFQTLNQPKETRQTNLDDELANLPFIDGPLFEERLDLPSFNSGMRDTLLKCAAFDWGKVSPVIFGSMFQSVMDPKLREQLGAHYTSETNIFKVIGPLFLDDLKAELEAAGNSHAKLNAFVAKLRGLHFLDPACGCGNFLVVTYRELRRLELEALKRLNIRPDDSARQTSALKFGALSQVNVDQMYGIEIEEFPARVASLALWLTDHQMNMELSSEFGERFNRLPLHAHPNIRIGNALTADWNEVVPKEQVSYILGNPPFIAKQDRSEVQKKDIDQIFGDWKGAGELDYVSAWYVKAVEFIKGTSIEVAFVSTNSITQGEQVGILWPRLLENGIQIFFAHRTFRWSNEAHGKAAVFCVIIGFSLAGRGQKRIFDYETPSSEPHEVIVRNINPYLLDSANIVVASRRKPLCESPNIMFGSMPNDGGHLLFANEKEKNEFLKIEPLAENLIRPFLSAKEFLNGEMRYCLWLKDAEPSELRKLPAVMQRIEEVRQHRLSSNRAATKKLAEFPLLFGEDRQPKTRYILIPRVSSEQRRIIPMAFFDADYIAGDTCVIVPGASLYHFGVLQSMAHMSWMRQVCGRLKGDYRYSNELVYNNYPWPSDVSDAEIKTVENAAQGVLDARKNHPDATLADLYDPLAMPDDLRKAHTHLDKAVDACYGKRTFKSEMERLEFLFGLYREYVEAEAGAEIRKKTRKKV